MPMGSSPERSSRNKMSPLLRGCFGCCRKSNEPSGKESKKSKRSLINCLKIRCSQKTDVSETEVCTSMKVKSGVLSGTRESRSWPRFKMTACGFFFRNSIMDRRYFQALKTEGLLMTIVSSVTSPVLNIAWCFTDCELTNTRQSFHSSFQKSHWDVVIYEGITEEMKANFNYDNFNEAILDGIPCSHWLEMIEPTIPMILELFSRRRRKTNLSRLRPIDHIYDDFMARHGDTFIDQLAPHMYGPQQVLVNRIHNTPFPTMELGAAAALVHNAMVNREQQFQEPFRSRRPNHRSRCTTRPRPLSTLSRPGWTPKLAADLVTRPDASITSLNSTAPTLVADPGYVESLVDRDPLWYVPVILQLAACSQMQFPDATNDSSEDDIGGCSGMDVVTFQSQSPDVINASFDDAIARCSGMGVACSHVQFPDVNNECYDDDIAGCSGMSVICFQSQSPDVRNVSSDDAIAGCSGMSFKQFSSDENAILYCSRSDVHTQSSQSSYRSEEVFLEWKRYELNVGSGYLNHKSEIDEVFAIAEDTSERFEALSEMVEDGNIDEYVDFILENAVISLSSIHRSNAHGLPPWYLSDVDITEQMQPEPLQSPSDMTCGPGVACTSTRDTEEQRTTCIPCPNPYHDECVIDEMAMLNLNQSGSHCTTDACLNNPTQINRMFHSDQCSSKHTRLAVKGETIVPATTCFTESCLSRELAMLNVNQSALHTHHEFKNRCEHSPDTWFYHGYETVYEPAKLRPHTSDLQIWKSSINMYIRGMPAADIHNPTVPSIIKSFDGRRGPLGRRFFVNCATELLNKIDKKESTRWIPTKKQRWQFMDRPEGYPAPVEKAVNTRPELPKSRQINSAIETKQRKHIIVECERRTSTRETPLNNSVRKKRKTKRRVSKSKTYNETSGPIEDSTEETADDPPGNRQSCSQGSNKTNMKNDRKGKIQYQSRSRGDESLGPFTVSENCTTTQGVHHVCEVEKGGCHFDEKPHSSEYEHSEEIRKRQIQSKKEDEQHIEAELGDKVIGDQTSTQYPSSIRSTRSVDPHRSERSNGVGCSWSADIPQIPRINKVRGGRSEESNTSHGIYAGRNSTLHPRSHTRNITTATVQKRTAGLQSPANRNKQSQSTKKSSCKSTTQDVNSSRSVSTKDRLASRTFVGESAGVSSINAQPPGSTEEMKHTPENCVFFKGDSDTNKNDIQHRKLSPFPGSKRRNDDKTKYVSSTNDADSSSSNCKDEPRRKSKVRYRKKRTDIVQRKQAVFAAGAGLGDHGISSCFLSSESKQILANLKHDDTSKKFTSDEESSGTEKDSRQSLSVCSGTKPTPNVDTSKVVQENTDQSYGTVIWALTETEMSRSSPYDEEIGEDEYDDTDYMDCRKSPITSLKMRDCEDDINEDGTRESCSVECNDLYWTEEEDSSYDTDASISDSLLGDEGYVRVNISDTFHSGSGTFSTSSESYTNQHVVHSSRRENRLGSGSFSSDCSLEYSPVQQDDCTATNSPSLCYKSTGHYCCKDSDTPLHYLAYTSTSIDNVGDHINGRHSDTVDKSSACAAPDDILDSDGSVSGDNGNEETDQNDIKHVHGERKGGTQSNQHHTQFSSLQINDRASVNDTQLTSGETDESAQGQDKSVSGDTSCKDNTKEPSGSEIHEHGAPDSNSDERRVRNQQARRFFDVGDWVTSVDVIRRQRESRRQRGILQYQWNGMYVLAQMYYSPVGQIMRQQRQQFRAWLDRRQRRLQRNH